MTDALELVRWVLATLGLIYMITQSVIFSGPRIVITRGSNFRTQLFYCPACIGFWIGVGSGIDHMFGQTGVSAVATVGQYAAMSMAIGALWAAYQGGNPAYENEAPMRGEALGDQKKESEDVE